MRTSVARNATAAGSAVPAPDLAISSKKSLQGAEAPRQHDAARPGSDAVVRAARITARVAVLAEGDYDIAVPAKGQSVAQLLDGLGIGERSSQLYVDGRAAGPDAIVRPGSRVDVLPAIRGG